MLGRRPDIAIHRWSLGTQRQRPSKGGRVSYGNERLWKTWKAISRLSTLSTTYENPERIFTFPQLLLNVIETEDYILVPDCRH